MSQEDDLARLRAEMDQAREGMKEVAASCWAFYAALQEEGFEAGQALKITISWLTEMLGKSSEPDE
jgi:cyclopropane fatty-acyl-phospholipid synthase-like methyltransferase